MTVYVTGDCHLGHTAIIKYTGRPFLTIKEHDEALIGERNRIVGPEDTVYDLGDVTLGDEQVARRYFARMNGKLFVLGNTFHHDRRWLSGGLYWTKHYEVVILPPIHTMKIDDLFIVLCHFPFAVWDRKHYNSLHLHAHCHNKYKPEQGLILDVGVDSIFKLLGQYRPISLDEIVEYMKSREE